MTKTAKIIVDVSEYPSVEALSESHVVDEISKKVITILEKQNQKAREIPIARAIKNSVSLLMSKKRSSLPSCLSIYLPINCIEASDDTVVPSVSSSEDLSDTSISENDDSLDNHIRSSSTSGNSHITFSVENDLLKANIAFEYLEDYFKYSLSINNKPMNIEKIVLDICKYAFIQMKCSVNIRILKREISRQISYIVKSARARAAGKNVIGILRAKNSYSFSFKSIHSLNQLQSSTEFMHYRNSSNLSPILFIKESSDEIAIFQFYPVSNTAEITINEVFVNKALSSFHLSRSLDVREISHLITQCAMVHDLNLDIPLVEEIIKTKILFDDRIPNSNYFLNITVNIEPKCEHDKTTKQNTAKDFHSSYEEEIEAIIGRTYTTRGIKRSYEEDPISIEPPKNMHRQNKLLKERRDLLHLKDAYHITDCAFNAIFKYIQSKRSLCSLKEIERLRKNTNSRFPIKFTPTSAYVKFEYAVRTAIFVARHWEPKLDQFDKLSIRFNMDGTLIGNKHIVAISINCVEGGRESQSSKNLVPLGLFEIEKENTELLRRTLPIDFINDIKSVKYISIGERNIQIRVRLGGDLMNAVYVFGLAGFSSNYPCVFCTQHKDDLHVTEETACDKTIVEGKGKNKKTVTIRVGPTSYHNVTKRARCLAEQKQCLMDKNNSLGYKCEPLFGDLFDYKDYCIDTLHMKLRIFDIILKDILAHASRTGKYGVEHLTIIENKIKVLNQHCEKTVGKRFFFQVDTDDKNKTISSHGKLSGHLQDLFFVDSFPYREILGENVARSARSVVDKFKELLKEVKENHLKPKNHLKRLSIEFVRVFRESGLRTTVTPYIHIIGNHLFEFNEFNDLGDYNMQGVEKNNDLLSRLYFSSTNPDKNPLLTMLQKLYRMLEMNFENEKDRQMMAEFARTGVYDFVEDPIESNPSCKSCVRSITGNELGEESSNEDEEQYLSSREAVNQLSDDSSVDLDESTVWAPEKRFEITVAPRTENRFKSFRR